MEGFDIFVMVLAVFTAIVVTVAKSKKQQDHKKGHPARPIPTPTPSRHGRDDIPSDVLEEVKRALAEAEKYSLQPEQGIENYMELEPMDSQQLKIGAEEGIRSTAAVKDEKYYLEKQNKVAKGVKVNIDPRYLIIYSEIMRPKWEEY